MPKDNSELLQRLRENRKKNLTKIANNKMASNLFQLIILGNGSEGNPRAVYVNTDRNSYLFNCGEGTQRLANEHKYKLGKLENIFITKRCSENLSGLVGMALTCQDIGVPSLTLHGPQNMELMLSLYEYFFKFSGMTISTKAYVDYHFEDTDLVVKCFPIFESLNEKPSNKRLKTESDSQIDEKPMSFLYLCRLKPRPGELLIQKCIDLKIPPGPLLGKLKSGQQITLSDNRVIRPEEVIGPADKGPVFIVLECPSIDYIESLVNNESILQSIPKEDLNLITVMVHITPSEVFHNQRYQQWIRQFGDSMDHLLLNEDNPSEGNLATNKIQAKLHLIDSFVFPLLKTNENIEKSENKNFINPKTMTKYILRPKHIRGIDLETAISDYDIQGYKNEALSNLTFVESLNEFHAFVAKSEPKVQEYPQIIFLGTGSAVPSKIRNTSAIWVNIDSQKSFLMDCGEGTYGQLCRFYGNETETYLKKLKAIYVSHLHADHHLGILQIIKKRSTLTSEPLVLIIPPAVRKWVLKYNQCVEKLSESYEMILCQEFLNKTNDRILEILGLSDMRTVLVPHCSHSYGISFTIKEPKFKIVYSGDTQPTVNLVRIGQDCDLLIHEASMEDGLVEEARIKFHSTTSEAIEKGVDMNAKFTILTHFSQRYAKVPVFNEKFNERVGIAFDNMRVRSTDFPKLPKMIACLKCLFEEQLEQLAYKTAVMERRKQLISQYHENNSQTNQT